MGRREGRVPVSAASDFFDGIPDPERVWPELDDAILTLEDVMNGEPTHYTPNPALVRYVMTDEDFATRDPSVEDPCGNLVTSRLRPDPSHGSAHLPLLDLDYGATLVPSSTPGHFHLYLDQPVAWDKYVAVLDAMVDAGMLQEGFVRHSKRRGFTALRAPGTKKAAAQLPEPYDPRCNRKPAQIREYALAAEDCYMTADEYVRREEGTYNQYNGHFLCTACYIAAGMPTTPDGWKCP